MPTPITAGQNFQVQYKKLSSDFTMPTMQAALDHYSIGYCVSGDRKTITPTGIFTQHAGEVGTKLPMLFHRTVPLSDAPYERFLVKYTKPMAQSFIDIAGQRAFDTLYSMHVHSFKPDIRRKIHHIMQEMYEEYENYNEYSEHVLKGMLTHLLLVVWREHLPASDTAIHFPYDNETMMEAVYYINSHYAEDPSLADVAAHVNLAPNYFSRLFKEMVGSPFSFYLTYTRLQFALLKLMQTDLPISQIAMDCGFSNANYFCDVFKKQYHLSPSQYRREHHEVKVSAS